MINKINLTSIHRLIASGRNDNTVSFDSFIYRPSQFVSLLGGIQCPHRTGEYNFLLVFNTALENSRGEPHL